MDDDLGFSSVWQESSPRARSPPLAAPEKFDYASFGDEPSFEPSTSTQVAPGDDDDFGDDFGDFGDADATGGFDDNDMGGFEDASFTQGGFEDMLPPDPGPSTWEPLRLRPMPSPVELSQSIEELLYPIYGHIDPASVMSQEGIRQVDGISQILTTPAR